MTIHLDSQSRLSGGGDLDLWWDAMMAKDVGRVKRALGEWSGALGRWRGALGG